jgi:hypothetical protein
MYVNSESVSNEIDESDLQSEKQEGQRIWRWRGIVIDLREEQEWNAFDSMRVNSESVSNEINSVASLWWWDAFCQSQPRNYIYLGRPDQELLGRSVRASFQNTNRVFSHDRPFSFKCPGSSFFWKQRFVRMTQKVGTRCSKIWQGAAKNPSRGTGERKKSYDYEVTRFGAGPIINIPVQIYIPWCKGNSKIEGNAVSFRVFLRSLRNISGTTLTLLLPMVQMPQKRESAQNTPNLDCQRPLKHVDMPGLTVTSLDGPCPSQIPLLQEKSGHWSEGIGQTADIRCDDVFHSATWNTYLVPGLGMDGWTWSEYLNLYQINLGIKSCSRGTFQNENSLKFINFSVGSEFSWSVAAIHASWMFLLAMKPRIDDLAQAQSTREGHMPEGPAVCRLVKGVSPWWLPPLTSLDRNRISAKLTRQST